MKAGNMELYATKNGVVAVENPVKIRMLGALGESGLSFEDIVSLVGRAKATVSVHLSDMKSMHLVAEKGAAGDRRKKVFYRTARLIGAAKPPERSVRAFVRTEIAESTGDPFAFMSSLFRAVRYNLEAMGFNTDPALRAAGRDIGIEVAKTLSATTLGGLEAEIPKFWARHRLGNMSFFKKDPLTIRVRDCVSTKHSPNTGKTACALSEGIIEAIFSSRLERAGSVRETKCHSTGYPYCEFVVTFHKFPSK